MRDKHDRTSCQPPQNLEDRGAVLLVQRPGRLVRKHELRVVDKSARDRETLLLASGKLVRQMIGNTCKPERVHELVRSSRPTAGCARKPGSQQDVLNPAQLL